MLVRLREVGLFAGLTSIYECQTLADLATILRPKAVEKPQMPMSAIPPGCEVITPDMLPLVALEVQHIERIVRSVPAGSENVQDIYPLAPSQEQLLFHHSAEERSGSPYVLAETLLVPSQGCMEALITALQAVIARHDVLRTAVLWEDLPQPVQVVYRRATLRVMQISLSSDRSPGEQFQDCMSSERQLLDVRQAPLLQLKVAADPQSDKWYVHIHLHRVIADRLTAKIVNSEAVAYLEGREEELPPSVPYRNHVAQALAYARTHRVEAHFRNKFGDIDEPTAPFGLLEPQADSSGREETREQLETALARRMRAQARRLGVGASALLHAAWALVVAHTSGRFDPVYGTTVSARHLHGNASNQGTIGRFINILPVRLRLRGVTAEDLVEQTQRELVDLLSHEHASLTVVQRCSGIVGSAPLFSTLFSYLYGISDSQAEWGESFWIKTLSIQERTDYPISVTVFDDTEGISLEVATDRRADSRRLAGHLLAATSSLVEALEHLPHTQALALSILPANERHKVLTMFNATRTEYLQEELVHELFEQQVRRTPHAVVAVYQGEVLTYAELNRRANRVARHLRYLGLEVEERVGLCVERYFSMLIGMLGILKAGGAYLPLDPEYPADRLMHMAQDAALHLILTQERPQNVLPGAEITLLMLDRVAGEADEVDDTNLDARKLGLTSRNLAYVLYTSGTTGKPKGAMIEHRGLINFIHVQVRNFSLSSLDRVLQLSSYGYDGVVEEVFPSLAVGATVILRPKEIVAPETSFFELLKSDYVTVVDIPTAFWHQWVWQESSLIGYLPRLLIVGGEKAERLDLDKWRRRLEGRQSQWLYTYGPTEATVIVVAFAVNEHTELSEGEIPLGRPISNTQIYILGERFEPAPIGVAGEIYIAGVAVGRGYLNRPELTSERYLVDLYGTDPQARMYKTGDVGRWRQDGTIEFLGRNDHQVKLRGFRVEPGEIEAQLRQYPKVKQAVVIAREDVRGDKRLVAYVVPGALFVTEEIPSAEELRAHLRRVLPAHMLPSAFVVLKELQLTRSGKVDRRALPVPDLEAYVRRRYEVPHGEVEEILARIWQEVLQVERVGAAGWLCRARWVFTSRSPGGDSS